MNKIIPILPCQSIKEQVAFYESLGFETIEIFTSPNPYAVLKYDTLEMHFYGSKRIVPAENANMCYLAVDDVDSLYEMFTSRLKESTGKIPRTGIPRVSKLKDLKSDRRFNITDVGGNTLFVGTQRTDQYEEAAFFRTIQNNEYAKSFAILYDLIYSKQDIGVAHNMLLKHFPPNIDSMDMEAIDLAKVLLVALDIYLQRNRTIDEKMNKKLKELMNAGDKTNPDWEKVLQQYNEIINIE